MNGSGCFLPFVLGAFGASIGGFSGGVFGAIVGVLLSNLLTKNTNVGKMDKSVLESITKLSLILMKADTMVMRSELYVFRDFMLQNFGSEIASSAIDMLQEFKDMNLTVDKAAGDINHRINYTERMQIMQFLVQLAAADNEINASEWTILAQIAQRLNIQQADFIQLKTSYQFYYSRQRSYQNSYNYSNQNSSYSTRQTSTSQSDYALLGVKSSDDNETIKAAYRRLAIANHPDKVQHLGETARKEAEKRFSEINQAYDRIKKSRGLS